MKTDSEINFESSYFGDKTLLILVCLLMFLKRVFLIKYEINYEEGKEIECILNILDGKMAFRDFHWQYGPAGIYLVAFLFKVFDNVNLLTPRLMVTLIAVATTFYSYRTARLYLGPGWSFWASLMASSGLVAREGTYGHGLAYLGMIGSFFHLATFFRIRRERELLIAGGYVFVALLAKPIVFGIGALFSVSFCLIWWEIMVRQFPFPGRYLKVLLLTGLLPGTVFYSFLVHEVSLERMFHELVPMASGTYNMGESMFFRPLFPSLNFSSFHDWIPKINSYLSSGFRWWTIVFSFTGGVFYLLMSKSGWRKDPQRYALFFFLLIYLLLIESETLILVSRPITFYINMLPCYILMAMVLGWLARLGRKRLVGAVATIFTIIYFFYPPVRLGIYYYKYGKPLGFPLVEMIKVPPYTLEGYRNIVEFVKNNAPDDKPFLFAGYDSFIYLFSEKKFFFQEDFTAFVKASFHPYNRKTAGRSLEFYQRVEENIVERVRRDTPGMILLPSSGLTEKIYHSSVFLKYLEENWRVAKRLNKQISMGPFDKINLQMDVYFPKYAKLPIN